MAQPLATAHMDRAAALQARMDRFPAGGTSNPPPTCSMLNGPTALESTCEPCDMPLHVLLDQAETIQDQALEACQGVPMITEAALNFSRGYSC